MGIGGDPSAQVHTASRNLRLLSVGCTRIKLKLSDNDELASDITRRISMVSDSREGDRAVNKECIRVRASVEGDTCVERVVKICGRKLREVMAGFDSARTASCNHQYAGTVYCSSRWTHLPQTMVQCPVSRHEPSPYLR